MLSPTPDPDRPLTVPACPRRRVSVTSNQTWHLLPTTGHLWPIPVPVRLSWTGRDPHAVTLAFRTGAARPVVWTVARDLLTAGLDAPTGLGDVTVTPDPTHPDTGEVLLSSPTGRACLRFRTTDMAGYLRRLPDPPALSPAVRALLAGVARHGLGESA